MTPLGERLIREIETAGPIGVDHYMAACTACYYAERQAFGRGGDFTTAPEVSQMFGELIGAWMADIWHRAGEPGRVHLVELGPGRGTMMGDMLRAARSTPDFAAAIDVHLVETSAALRALQASRVPEAKWHDALETVPDDAPLMLVANEFFDTVPVRQLVQIDGKWQERRVATEAGRLCFSPAQGLVRETAPARAEWAARIGSRIATQRGAALIADYGYWIGDGDTLQAVQDHAPVGPLAAPGESDISAHVGFADLARAAAGAGALVSPLATQGAFLRALGIEHRAERLTRGLDAEAAHAVASAMRRLTAPQAMGETFKVLALRSPDWPMPGVSDA